MGSDGKNFQEPKGPLPLQMAAGEEQVKMPKTNAIKGGTIYLV